MPRLVHLVALLVGWLVAAAAVSGQPLPAVGDDAWQPVEIPGVDKPTTYRVVVGDDGAILRADSECGASGMAVSLYELDLRNTPLLSWEWRIERALDVAAERTRAGDDFAARVIVMFEYDSAQATFVERAQHALAETMQGRKLPGRSLAYVWSSRQDAGTVWRNPFRSPTMLVSRGRGERREWKTETVDLSADYRRLWQAEPPRPVGLAVLTDADNTCSRAIAEYRNFRLMPPR